MSESLKYNFDNNAEVQKYIMSLKIDKNIILFINFHYFYYFVQSVYIHTRIIIKLGIQNILKLKCFIQYLQNSWM